MKDRRVFVKDQYMPILGGFANGFSNPKLTQINGPAILKNLEDMTVRACVYLNNLL